MRPRPEHVAMALKLHDVRASDHSHQDHCFHGQCKTRYMVVNYVIWAEIMLFGYRACSERDKTCSSLAREHTLWPQDVLAPPSEPHVPPWPTDNISRYFPAREHVLWPQNMFYSHRTCSMAKEHALDGRRTCAL